MRDAAIHLEPVGVVESTLADRAAAPKQGHEGAPEASLVFDEAVRDALDGLRPGDRVIVLTWLHLADRDILRVHPRDDLANPEQGVFNTRSSDRPNPIGLHEVEIVAIDALRVRVRPLEAVDGTPVLDLKPVLRPLAESPETFALPAVVRQAPAMVSESHLKSTEHGLVPEGEGWFVLNAREARWLHAPGRSAICEFEGPFEGEQDFLQFGINISVLEPGVSMAMYHWEADQEDFLVLAGEALLIVEGEERPLRQWDFVHCPPGTKHVIVGAGQAPAVVLAVGARDGSTGPESGAYTVDEAAVRHGAGVEEETTESSEAYASLRRRQPASYGEGWLPGS